MQRALSFSSLMIIMLLLGALPMGSLWADGGGGGGGDSVIVKLNPDMAQAVKLIDASRFAEALPALERVIAKDARNADAYNLLGYSKRKLDRFDEALRDYQTALRINPKHRGAHEYIGETYLALGQVDKAREHLAFLDDDCWLGCEEYDDLKAAIERHNGGKSG